MAPTSAELESHFIGALRRFVDETNAISKALPDDTEPAWYRQMIEFATQAAATADHLESPIIIDF